MTQNLGTKAGAFIPSGGKLAGEPVKNAVVSEYAKYYGTYSGADIKVVVHYPWNPGIEKGLQVARADMERQLFEVRKQLLDMQLTSMDESAVNNGLINQIAYAQQDEAAIARQLQKLDDDIISRRNLPTSKVLGEITSFSWSVYREKDPFRPLGSVYPRTYTRGPRTIGGTMVFTIFHEHVFHELMNVGLGYYDALGTNDFDQHLYTTMLADQIRPLDISLIFANEYGAISHMGFWGLEFFQEGGTFSIEDIYSENVLQYVARDFDPMRTVGQRMIDGQGVTPQMTASNMLSEQIAMSTVQRRNPFI